MNKFRYFIYGFAFLLFLLPSCMSKPGYEGVEDLRLDSITNDEIFATLDVKIFNPNAFKLKTLDIDYLIYFEGVKIADGKIYKGYELEPKSPAVIPTTVVLNTDSLVKGFVKMDNVSDTFAFTLIYKVKFNNKLLKINVKDRISISRDEFYDMLIRQLDLNDLLKLRRVQLLGAGPFETRLSVVLELNNKYPVAYRLDSLKLSVYPSRNRSDVAIGYVELDKPIYVEAMDHRLLTLKVSIDNIKTLRSLITGGMSFFLKGEAQISFAGKDFVLPLSFTYRPGTF